MIDIYRSKKHPAERMATKQGAGLPAHVAAKDWKLMPADLTQVTDDVEEDIAARGFSFFEML